MKIFIFLLFLFPFLASASFDEFSIFNEDKSCGIHYLSSQEKIGWFIKVDSLKCKEGWVDGFAQVEIFSPKKEKKEILSGFFSKGYWSEDFPTVDELVERASPKERVQILSFMLGKDSDANITYLGQLRAEQPPNRPYSSFQGCPDFRVLVVVPDEAVFENIAFQNKIIEQGMKYAKSYCSKPEILALFGATTLKNPEIKFQMQIDCSTQARKIIPLQKNKKEETSSTPLEIRKEGGDSLMYVDGNEDMNNVSYIPPKILFPKKEEKKLTKTVLSHLKILSKISKKPVEGRIVLHIKRILLDGSAQADLPSEITLLYHPNFKEGWAVVEGTFQDDTMQVSNIQFCEKEWCSDVP